MCLCSGWNGMDVVFSVCIVTRGAVGAHVWDVCEFRHADVVSVSCVHHVVVLNSAFCTAGLAVC